MAILKKTVRHYQEAFRDEVGLGSVQNHLTQFEFKAYSSTSNTPCFYFDVSCVFPAPADPYQQLIATLKKNDVLPYQSEFQHPLSFINKLAFQIQYKSDNTARAVITGQVKRWMPSLELHLKGQTTTAYGKRLLSAISEYGLAAIASSEQSQPTDSKKESGPEIILPQTQIIRAQDLPRPEDYFAKPSKK